MISINKKSKKYILIKDDNESACYELSNKRIEKISDSIDDKVYLDKSINCIISDSFIELKSLEVPSVANSIMPSVIKNTLKKFSTITPLEDDFDYLILEKDKNQCKVITFINHYKDKKLIEKRNIYVVYQLISRLMEDSFFFDDSRFLIKEGKTLFLYTFKERRFHKRTIYFEEDLETLPKDSIYYLDLLENEMTENEFLKVPEDKVVKALASLDHNLFEEKKEIKLNLYAVVLGVVLLLAALFLEYRNMTLAQTNADLMARKTLVEKKLKVERNKQKLNDENYRKIKYIINNRSNVQSFFFYLYSTGAKNIKIKQVTYTNGKFSIAGSCLSDKKLEDSFRKLKYWEKVTFSFTKKTDRIDFRIQGEFAHE